MAIGITKTTTLTKWEVPLQHGDLPEAGEINDWKDNKWLIDHLRHLADKIEKENPRIINIGLYTDYQYKSPKLFLELYENK